MHVHLLDGTYELFRHFYAVPSLKDASGTEIGGVRAVLGSVVGMLERDATYLGVATDHVVESFRNELWPGYKTGEGIDPALLSQFPLIEQALQSMGVVVWPMVRFEADDALASAAVRASADPIVERVFLYTPDKDLAQVVRGTRIVQVDRRSRSERDAAGVEARFGVRPTSMADFLALVGDAADGYPGLPGWGVKSAATVLARYEHLEAIPEQAASWTVSPRNAARLAATLAENRPIAFLFRELATVRTDVPTFDTVEELRWRGPCPEFFDLCARLDAAGLFKRVQALSRRLG